MNDKKYFKKQKELIRGTKWIDDLIDKGSYCHTCGNFIDPMVMRNPRSYFNNHHISGRKNSDITIPICPNCHAKLTLNQKSWDKRWIEKDNPPNIVFAIMLRGISDILILMARILKDYSNKILKGEIYE